MSKHVGSRLRQILPLIGIGILIVGLLAIARIAVDNGPAESPIADVAARDTQTAATDATSDAPAPRTEKDEKSDKKSTATQKRRQKKLSRELRKKVETKAAGGEDELPEATFKIASFNVLGASHSDGGNKAHYASGATRARGAAARLKALGVSVVGLQEYETAQHNAFVGATGWGVFPGMRIGTKGVRNSIAWNPAVWTEVESHTGTFPYFRGKSVPLPYVLLEHKESGRRAWFISIHNPVSNGRRGQNQHWRNVATAKEGALMTSLLNETGYPVFLTGDFNERGEAFCQVTSGGRAVSANGGTGGPPCSPPGSMGIDWIFASPIVGFSGYVRDNSVIGRISDHPLIYATATLSGDVPGPNTD